MKLARVVGLCAAAALLSLGALFYFSVYDHEQNLEMKPRTFAAYDPLEHCVTPFGTVLGYSKDVPAMSNCLSTFKSTYINYVNLMDPLDVGRRGDPSETTVVMVGFRHTALDFYMRWMARNYGVMPRLVEDTNAFWKQNYFYNPAKPQQDWEAEYISDYAEATELEEIKFNAPRKGDAILYSADPERIPNGHVAVIVKVEADIESVGADQMKELKKQRIHPRLVYVAEQNFKNLDWGGKSYTRVLRFQWRPLKTGKGYEGYYEDPDGLPVIGIVRVGKAMPLKSAGDPYEETLNKDDHDGDL